MFDFIKKLRPDNPLAQRFNALTDAVHAAGHVTAAPPLNVDMTPGGVHLWLDRAAMGGGTIHIDLTTSITINTQGAAIARIAAPTCNLTVHGFSGGWDGRFLIVWNVGDYPIILAHQSAAADAEIDMMLCPPGHDLYLLPGWMLQMCWMAKDNNIVAGSGSEMLAGEGGWRIATWPSEQIVKIVDSDPVDFSAAAGSSSADPDCCPNEQYANIFDAVVQFYGLPCDQLLTVASIFAKRLGNITPAAEQRFLARYVGKIQHPGEDDPRPTYVLVHRCDCDAGEWDDPGSSGSNSGSGSSPCLPGDDCDPPDPPLPNSCCEGIVMPSTLYARVTASGFLTTDGECSRANIVGTSYRLDYDAEYSGGCWVSIDPIPHTIPYNGYYPSLQCNDGTWKWMGVEEIDSSTPAVTVTSCNPFVATAIFSSVFFGDITFEITEVDTGTAPRGNACNIACAGGMSDIICMDGAGFSEPGLNVSGYKLYRAYSADGLNDQFVGQLVRLSNGNYGWYYLSVTDGGGTGLISVYGFPGDTFEMINIDGGCTWPKTISAVNYNGTPWALGSLTVYNDPDCTGGGGGGGCSSGQPVVTFLGTFSAGGTGNDWTGVPLDIDAILIVDTAYYTASAGTPNPSANTCTYNGHAMTRVSAVSVEAAPGPEAAVQEQWYYKNNTGGPQTGSVVHTVAADPVEGTVMSALQVECLTNNTLNDSGTWITYPASTTYGGGTVTTTAPFQFIHAAFVTLFADSADADGTWDAGSGLGAISDDSQHVKFSGVRLCSGSRNGSNGTFGDYEARKVGAESRAATNIISLFT